MQQLDAFNNGIRVKRDGLSLKLIPEYIPAPKAKKLFETLVQSTQWQQPSVKVFGKWQKTPRLIQFFADSGLEYNYSSTQHGAQAWTPILQRLKNKIGRTTSHNYNSVFLIFYRNGHDTLGWHADNERELGEQPCIASLSLGAPRDILFKAKHKRGANIKLTLQPGSLLIMDGTTQQAWQHCIPKRASCSASRLNLTFRMIFPACD